MTSEQERIKELEATIERLRHGIEAALHRYDDPREKHNWEGGFLRGELAWAMANDLRKALADETG